MFSLQLFKYNLDPSQLIILQIFIGWPELFTSIIPILSEG